jgi:integral membrane protein
VTGGGATGRLGYRRGVKSLLLPYRVMANVVGVLLVVLILLGVPLANFDGGPMWGVFPSTPELTVPGSSAHDLGEWITHVLGVAHGWLYMIFLLVAFMLSRRAEWGLGFTAVTLLAGTVPLLSFWAEHRATRDVRTRIAAEEVIEGEHQPADRGPGARPRR